MTDRRAVVVTWLILHYYDGDKNFVLMLAILLANPEECGNLKVVKEKLGKMGILRENVF